MIRDVGGMALLNSHPDYLADLDIWHLYEDLLEAMAARRDEHWHALPAAVAAWWRRRAEAAAPLDLPGACRAFLELDSQETGSERLARPAA